MVNILISQINISTEEAQVIYNHEKLYKNDKKSILQIFYKSEVYTNLISVF